MNEQFIISELSKAMGHPAVEFGELMTIERAMLDLACLRLRDAVKTQNALDHALEKLNGDGMKEQFVSIPRDAGCLL